MDVDKMRADTMDSLNSDMPGTVTFLQVVVFFQFGVSVGICILTTIGISFGYAVSSFYLMTLLQIILAIPGLIYIKTHGSVFIALYVAFEIMTAGCELFWLIYMFFDNQPIGRWISLMLLTILQVVAIIVAVFFREKKVKCMKKPNKKNKDKKNKKPELKNASRSLKDSSSRKKKRNTKSKKSARNDISRSTSEVDASQLSSRLSSEVA